MKLFFLHQPKTAGTTFRSLLSQSKSSLNLSSINLDVSPKDLYKCINDYDIIHLMTFNPSLKGRLAEYWNQLLDQSIFVVIVRNPISLFESVWRYQFQISDNDGDKIHHIPFDPVFNKSSIGTCPDINSMHDYIDLETRPRLTINEWCELIIDHERRLIEENKQYNNWNSALNLYQFPIANDDKEEHWYFENPLYIKGWDLGIPNNQYYRYTHHLSDQCFDYKSYSSSFPQLIILSTEAFDQSFAANVFFNKKFREFTIFSNLSKFNYQEVVREIGSLRKNQTESIYRRNSEFLLNSKNRILYYKYSHKDYKLWTSTLYRSLFMIKHCQNKIDFQD